MAEKELGNFSKKERREMAKSLKVSQAGKDKTTGKIFGAIIVLIIIAAAVGLYFLSGKSGTRKELGESIPVDPQTGRLHINVGEQHAPYSSNPPTSGPHYNVPGFGPIECKAYDDEVLDEGAIHNLEHGAIWVTYKDKNDKTLKEELDKFAKDNSKVIVSPRAKDDSAIAVVGWGRLLKLDKFEKSKIQDFINSYKNGPNVPEPLAGCGTAMPK